MSLIKNKKRFRIIFISVSVVFLLIFGLVSLYNFRLEQAKKVLSKSHFFIRNTGCVVKTFGRSADAVSAVISFYTPTGELVKSYERSWQGWELKFECIVLKLGENYWVFPHRVFSDKTRYGTGVWLFNLYSVNNYPAVYDYSFFTKDERAALETLFRLAKFSPYLFKFFSGAKAMTINLREFKPDKEYGLCIDPHKGLYLKKN